MLFQLDTQQRGRSAWLHEVNCSDTKTLLNQRVVQHPLLTSTVIVSLADIAVKDPVYYWNKHLRCEKQPRHFWHTDFSQLKYV